MVCTVPTIMKTLFIMAKIEMLIKINNVPQKKM